jgi:predicted TIM-barrel fold metal-dependent hydrolase
VIVDTNVYLSRWPFRRLPGDETPELVKMLRRHGVTQAWAGSFDGLLHKDIAGVNSRLSDECRRHGGGLLLPFGSINPKLPDWEEDVRRCAEEHRMPGIRLHPNYHGYRLDDPAFAPLLRLSADRGLLVQLVLEMEDERTQHPLLGVPPVDPAPLATLLPEVPRARLMILNGMRTLRVVALRKTPLPVEIAMLEGAGGLGRLMDQAGAERVCFGSYAPFYTMDSVHLKLKESGLDDVRLRAVLFQNAKRLLEEDRR